MTQNKSTTAGARTQFRLDDRANLKMLRDQIDHALAAMPFAAAFGLTFHAGNIKFESTGTGCTIKLEVRAPGEGGVITPKHEQDFDRYHQLFHFDGLRAEHKGQVCMHKGETWRLIGLCPKRRKFPLLVEHTKTKKQVLLPLDAIPKLHAE